MRVTVLGCNDDLRGGVRQRGAILRRRPAARVDFETRAAAETETAQSLRAMAPASPFRASYRPLRRGASVPLDGLLKPIGGGSSDASACLSSPRCGARTASAPHDRYQSSYVWLRRVRIRLIQLRSRTLPEASREGRNVLRHENAGCWERLRSRVWLHRCVHHDSSHRASVK